MDLLREFLKRNKERRLNIHCLGDAMIDEYTPIKVNRISPEWPAMVMHSANNNCIRKPGGAANVVYQLKNFNVSALLVCWTNILAENIFSEHRIPFRSLQSTDVPIKRRFLDGGTQVARYDIEDYCCGLSTEQIDAAIKQIGSFVKNKPDLAIFSDYNKGFFSSQNCRALDFYAGIPTIVDPKVGPLSKWVGCTVFKPNAKEALELTGEKTWESQAKKLQQLLECESVVITFGGEKVAGICGSDLFFYQPDIKINVESSVGAGDCFAAFFGMAFAHGFSAAEASVIAWNAGANYVQHKRNSPIAPAELVRNGIVEPEDLTNREFKLAFTNGCFDLLHEGHLKTLEFAKSKGDKLVVALNTDASIKRLKGEGRPIKPLQQRMAVMAALKPVDFVVSFDEDTPFEIIKKIMPDALIKGSDYQMGEIVGADIVPEVYRVPLVEGLSTTNFLR